MASVTRIVIGEKHFSNPVMGFAFVDSICIPEEEIDENHVRIRRLTALFPGTHIETTATQPEEKREVDIEIRDTLKARAEAKVRADAESARKAAEKAEHEAVMQADKAPEAEVVETGEEAVAEAGVEDATDLSEGLRVMAEHEGEICKGTIVGVFESGVIRVKLDDDDAAYRVIERDRVVPADQES